ncbi:sulfotransferase 4A1 isoform X1 [Drosophila miranda]|uniref:sulfotransferase 4A1 isoform X1 n=2 Tax=Drosophila miranda TaxID=7229 RepID=UPI0007E71065|nr:sulfotransferase 4A1 isoform X1 [Drosophila miranda]
MQASRKNDSTLCEGMMWGHVAFAVNSQRWLSQRWQLVARAMEKSHLKFPHDIRDVEESTNAELLEYFKGERNGFVQVGAEGYFFPNKFKDEAEKYYNFEARPNDVWIVTVPRSGTTWTQELIWLLANGLDFEQAQRRPLTERFPFFEFPLFMHSQVKAELLEENHKSADALEFIEKISRPGYEVLSEVPSSQRRFIKTHFPFSLLPPSVLQNKCKIVYVARNPKDVAVSYYHLNRLFRTQGYIGDFERFWRYFQRGLNPWLPYYSHVNEAQNHCHLSNVLFLRYEDMLKDLPGTVHRIGSFLDCRPTAADLDRLLDHLSIENFRENKSVNMHEMASVGILNKNEAGFVRSGGGESAKNGPHTQREFVDNPKLLKCANEWIEQNVKCFETI